MLRIDFQQKRIIAFFYVVPIICIPDGQVIALDIIGIVDLLRVK